MTKHILGIFNFDMIVFIILLCFNIIFNVYCGFEILFRCILQFMQLHRKLQPRNPCIDTCL